MAGFEPKGNDANFKTLEEQECKIFEGSLAVKLPTIWADEKKRWEESEKRREEKRREEKRREKKKREEKDKEDQRRERAKRKSQKKEDAGARKRITTTHLSYGVLSLKLLPPPCAVLLVVTTSH